MTDIYVLIYIVLVVLIYNLISLYIVFKKQKLILSESKKYVPKKKKVLGKYINKIESKLFNLGYPYGLNLKKYLIIKYVLSTCAFLLSYLNYHSFRIPFILGVVIFLIPNYLMHSYIQKEKYILINELKNIVNAMILCLSSYATLKDTLDVTKNVIKHKRFYDAYEFFIKEYHMNGYNIKEAALTLGNKFKTYEVTLFLGSLIQGDKDGTLLECLEKYRDTLELNYFKYLKRKAAMRLLYVTLGTVLALVNIVLVIMYPIVVQVLNNLNLIFA